MKLYFDYMAVIQNFFLYHRIYLWFYGFIYKSGHIPKR